MKLNLGQRLVMIDALCQSVDHLEGVIAVEEGEALQSFVDQNALYMTMIEEYRAWLREHGDELEKKNFMRATKEIYETLERA